MRINNLLHVAKRQWGMIVGIVVIALTPVWIYVFLPRMTALPENFSQSAQVDSYDNFYNESASQYFGEQRSATDFSYSRTKAVDRTAHVRNNFSVRALSGDLIFETTRNYAIDPLTWKHVAGGDQTRSGYLFAPRMKGLLAQQPPKSAFDYWHVNYDRPIRMEYHGEEDLYGLHVYEYESAFTVDQTKELSGSLKGVGEKTGISVDVNLHLWVEPYTGRVLKYADTAEAFYYDLASGTRLHPWNKFRNKTSDISVSAMSSVLASQKMYFILLEYGVSAALILTGLILMMFSMFMGEDLKKTAFGSSRSWFVLFVLPYLLVSVLMLSVVLVAVLFKDTADRQRMALLNNEAERIESIVRSRLEMYAYLLRGGVALFDSSDTVSRMEWRTFTQSLDTQRALPGIQGYGFSKVIPATGVSAFEKMVRSEGYKDFRVTPTTTRSAYTSILYLEPMDKGNVRAFGYDMFSESVRNLAMSYARDTGKVGMTGRVTLVQDEQSNRLPGFLIYLPVYKPGLPPDASIEQRRAQIYGYVYAPFRANDFMEGSFLGKALPVGVEIFDGENEHGLSEERLMFRKGSVASSGGLEVIRRLSIFNHDWTIRYVSDQTFGIDPIQKNWPAFILISGMIVSSLLVVLIYLLNRRRRIASDYAKQMSTEYEKFKQAVDGASDQVMITDKDGKILYANPSSERITGYSISEMIGKKAGSSELWGGHMGKAFYKNLWDTLLKRKQSFVGRFENTRKNGERYFSDMTISPIFDASKQIQFFVAIERDVTKERKIDEAKTDFLSLASHQLRMPLSAIKWMSELLMGADSEGLSIEQKGYVSDIHSANERMISLTNSLLDVAQAELGTYGVGASQINIVEIAKSVVKDHMPVITKKHLRLNESYDVTSSLMADPKVLQGIMRNLISNAVKYTQIGGRIDFKIFEMKKGTEVEGRRIGSDSIMIVVRDTGCGIPVSQQGSVFTKMFRADNVREAEPDGTGLGLYVVKTIVEQVGGDVWFSSEEEKGSVFSVALPLDGLRGSVKGGRKK